MRTLGQRRAPRAEPRGKAAHRQKSVRPSLWHGALPITHNHHLYHTLPSARCWQRRRRQRRSWMGAIVSDHQGAAGQRPDGRPRRPRSRAALGLEPFFCMLPLAADASACAAALPPRGALAAPVAGLAPGPRARPRQQRDIYSVGRASERGWPRQTPFIIITLSAAAQAAALAESATAGQRRAAAGGQQQQQSTAPQGGRQEEEGGGHRAALDGRWWAPFRATTKAAGGRLRLLRLGAALGLEPFFRMLPLAARPRQQCGIYPPPGEFRDSRGEIGQLGRLRVVGANHDSGGFRAPAGFPSPVTFRYSRP